MAIQILMTALSRTMEEGKLAKWLVKEGEEVRSGDVLAEIETDKATMEFEAVDEGRIGKILIPEGTEGVKVNQPIAELLQKDEPNGTSESTRQDHGRQARSGRDAGAAGGNVAPVPRQDNAPASIKLQPARDSSAGLVSE